MKKKYILLLVVLFVSGVFSQVEALPFFTKSYALLIGINKYESWPPLAYPKKDLEVMEEKLADLGFAEVTTLSNEEATRENILKTLTEDLVGKIKSKDQLLIFFSGHTHTEKTVLKTKKGYLIPFEAKKKDFTKESISLEELKRNIRRLAARHVLIIVDGCISGLGITKRYGLPYYRKQFELERATNKRVVQIIVPCKGDEKMEESGIKSLFIRVLMNGLAGEADKDGNNLLAGSELGSYIRAKLAYESNRSQNSLYGKINGEGEFVFSLKGKTLKPVSFEEMVFVPGGEFVMGIGREDEGSYDENPQRRVYLDPYYIGKYETTNFLYRRFIKETGHRRPRYWREPRLNQPNQPVVGVDWVDAVSYCNWAGKRLPTEAEWEKAARGTGGYKYPWGNDPDTSRGNFAKTASATTLVGKYKSGKSVYGAYDLAGNVWEWVNDWYEDLYYARRINKNPEGPLQGTKKILRGGSWYSSAFEARSSKRFWINSDYRYFDVGFRCAE